jgi:PAS domain S-box-containing protein
MRSVPPELARSALDAAPDAMIIIDETGIIRFANHQVDSIFGYGHEEIVGRPVEVLMPERFRGRHLGHRQKYHESVRLRPMGVGLDLFGRRRDGSEFPVEISLSPVEDAGHTLVVAAIRDVTDRKRVEAELNAQLEDMRRLRDLSTRLVEAADLTKVLEEMLDATIALQRAAFGNVQLCDPASGRLEIVAQRGFSQRFLERFARVDRDQDCACGRALRQGERVIIEDVEMDGGYVPYRELAAAEGYRAVQSTPIRGRNGRPIGMLSTHFREPHRPSERELQLTDLYLRMVSELIYRARDADVVRTARDLATRANEAKSRFLATASHDLRQPLQTLEMLNGSLRRMATSATVADAVMQQQVAIGAMSRLLNALLDISKLESGAVRPELVDFPVATLFEDLLRAFAASAGEKGLKFEITAAREIAHSDPSLIEQILRNLVSNAVKYTQRGSVHLRCVCESDATLRLEVTDTGIGIPAEQIQFIYDEFYQVGVPSNSSREGYGLGLSIVQRLVKLLDLKLDVRSEVGKGTVFSLTVPASAASSARLAAAAHAAQERGPDGRPAAAPRVLLVEDDKSVRDATRLLFTVEGYRVTAVATLAEALEHAAGEDDIDLLVTDYHLANGETGTAVIAALREARGSHLKAVLITGDTSAAVKELPSDPLMRIASKPVRGDELLSLMRTLIAA